MHLLGSIWISDIFLWNPIQGVSCYALSRLIWIPEMPLWNIIQDVSCCMLAWFHINFWHALMKSHLVCELLCASSALFESLICLYESYPDCELLCASYAPHESLICLYEILSRLWVYMCFLGFIWVSDMPLWNLIQVVSCCVPVGLYELLTCHCEIASR